MKNNCKTLGEIIKENKDKLISGEVLMAYSPEFQITTGIEYYTKKIDELNESALNIPFLNREWEVKDGKLIIDLFK